MKARFLKLFFLMIFSGLVALAQEKDNQHSQAAISVEDSLKNINTAAAVVPFGDTLFLINERVGSFSARERALVISDRIKKIGNQRGYTPDSLNVVLVKGLVDIVYGDVIILSVTPKDVPEGVSVMQVANEWKDKIANAIAKYQDKVSLPTTLKHLGIALVILAVLFFLIKYTNRAFKFISRKIITLKGNKIKGVSVKSYNLMDANKETKLIVFVVNILRYVIIGVIAYFGVLSLFNVFPSTEHIADKLLGYFLNPLQKMYKGFVSYIPSLITIVVICFVFHYLIKGIRYFANEIANGVIKINGFYPDWARPTFNIIKVLLYAFMFIIIFPYLPGSDSGVFQGVSVFLGVIISLGSTSLISNLTAGFVLTYMRSFKKGDRVKIGDVIGNVIEKTPFVIRIKTPKNEEITIPNSNIMSGHTINYTSSAQNYGLIVHVTITIGYDTPWQQAHQLLLQAASKTPNLLSDPKPFVLQTALDDSYVRYQINGYTKVENEMPRIYSDLYKNVMEVFNEAGIDIVSPHYYAQRDSSKPIVPFGLESGSHQADKTS